jgi:predicted nucleic acid-binding Zn finger protein
MTPKSKQIVTLDPELDQLVAHYIDTVYRHRPELHSRIRRAAGLVAAGAVSPASCKFNADLYGTIGRVLSSQGAELYVIQRNGEEIVCTCPDFQFEFSPRLGEQRFCKHIIAVKFARLLGRLPEPPDEPPQVDAAQVARELEEMAEDRRRRQIEHEQKFTGCYGRQKGGTRAMEARRQPALAAAPVSLADLDFSDDD